MGGCVAGGDGVAGGSAAVTEAGRPVTVTLDAIAASVLEESTTGSAIAAGCRLHADSKKKAVMRSVLTLTPGLLSFALPWSPYGELHGNTHDNEHDKDEKRDRCGEVQ